MPPPQCVEGCGPRVHGPGWRWAPAHYRRPGKGARWDALRGRRLGDALRRQPNRRTTGNLPSSPIQGSLLPTRRERPPGTQRIERRHCGPSHSRSRGAHSAMEPARGGGSRWSPAPEPGFGIPESLAPPARKHRALHSSRRRLPENLRRSISLDCGSAPGLKIGATHRRSRRLS